MKTTFSAACLIVALGLHASGVFAQTKKSAAAAREQNAIVARQVVVDDIERRLGDLSLPAARVFVRQRLAARLWRDGADKTGRAEGIATRALDELLAERESIPKLYFVNLRTQLFSLLELRAPATARRLRQKYKLEDAASDKVEEIYDMLGSKTNDRAAADKLRRFFDGATEFDSTALEIVRILQERGVPEANGVLDSILTAGESGGLALLPATLSRLVDAFEASSVPDALKKRFVRIALAQAKQALRPGDEPSDDAFGLLRSVMPMIAAAAPELMPEATILEASLAARISQARRKADEQRARVEASDDKVEAWVAEAERAQDIFVKYSLYDRAFAAAMEEKKFSRAVELAGRMVEVVKDEPQPPTSFRIGYHDQKMGEVADAALESGDVASAEFAARRCLAKTCGAKTYLAVALHHFERREQAGAVDALGLAEKQLLASESGTAKTHASFRFVSAAAKIDAGRLADAVGVLAAALGTLPSPGPDDKPGTSGYERYAVAVMVANWNLASVIAEIAKDHPNEAATLVDRIDRKEVKIAGACFLAIESLDAADVSARPEPRVAQ